jgi:CHAT domain-containing protein
LVISSEVDMLLVGEDCAKNPALNRLWSVRRELKCIELVAKSQQFGRAVEVIGSAATVQQVTEQVKSASFLHLACHGIQDQTNALESGFYLSDGKLTISKLMDLQLEKPWLAYLSACETAKGDAKQPDQVMHLAAAMLFAGFKHVIATMW